VDRGVASEDARASEDVDVTTEPPSPVDAGGEAPPVPPNGWWDPQWTHRSKITVHDADLKETLADFQIPVKLDAASILYAAAKSAGEDLRFVGEDGRVLSHEIDAWDPAGSSLVWLRVPSVGPAPTVVWMYYGNPAATAPTDADVKAVWPLPYTGVWHLSGGSKDSTPNAFDGKDMVGGSWADAKFARGLKLDGSRHDHIDLKNDIKLVAGAPGCTFSAWINPTKIEDSVNGMIIMTVGKWFNDNHNSYTDFNVNAMGQMISHVDPGTNTAASGYARILSDPGFIKVNEWAWVTYVVDLAANQERFFKNGQLVSTKPPPKGTFDAPAFIDMVSTRVVIGSEEDNVSHWYTGSMDELRIEKGMRPAPWIAAQYRAMTAAGVVTIEKDR
jgi:biopolymer transport protein ExbB